MLLLFYFYWSRFETFIVIASSTTKLGGCPCQCTCWNKRSHRNKTNPYCTFILHHVLASADSMPCNNLMFNVDMTHKLSLCSLTFKTENIYRQLLRLFWNKIKSTVLEGYCSIVDKRHHKRPLVTVEICGQIHYTRFLHRDTFKKLCWAEEKCKYWHFLCVSDHEPNLSGHV